MKATVMFEKNPVKISFVDSGLDATSGSGLLEEKVLGVLIVLNSMENIIQKNNENSQKLIDGISAEISLSYTYGWTNIHYCSFPKYKTITSDDLPEKFMSAEGDLFCSKKQTKNMYEFVEKYKNTIKKIRLIGVISSDEVSLIENKIKEINSSIAIEKDSPYLVIV